MNCKNQVVQEVNVDEDVPTIEQNYVVFSHHNVVEFEDTAQRMSHQFLIEYGYENSDNAHDDQTFSNT